MWSLGWLQGLEHRVSHSSALLLPFSRPSTAILRLGNSLQVSLSLAPALLLPLTPWSSAWGKIACQRIEATIGDACLAMLLMPRFPNGAGKRAQLITCEHTYCLGFSACLSTGPVLAQGRASFPADCGTRIQHLFSFSSPC